MNGIQPDQIISIRLAVQAWNQIVALLAKSPFDQVAPLIGEMQRQCQMHEMQQRHAESVEPPQ